MPAARAVVIAALWWTLGSATAHANEWRDLMPSTSAGPKDGHMMAYDSESELIVLFGDHGRIDPLSEETWAYDVRENGFRRMSPAESPTPQAHGAMVYDAGSDLVVLHGGQPDAGGGALAETWTYDVDADRWSRLATTGDGPGARQWHAMAYDERCDRVLLYGGTIDTAGGGLDDLFALDTDRAVFRRVGTASPRPPAMYWHSMAYDRRGERVILVGRGMETWAYDCAADRWERRSPAAPPVTGDGSPIAAMAYDAESGLLVYLWDAGVTWGYDPAADAWSDLRPAGPMPRVHHHAMVYADVLDRIVLYGEESSFMRNGTFAYEHRGGLPPLPDAGPPPADAGPPDADSAPSDGGGRDAGAAFDAGAGSRGSGCAVGHGATGSLLPALVLLLGSRPRKRSRRAPATRVSAP